MLINEERVPFKGYKEICLKKPYLSSKHQSISQP